MYQRILVAIDGGEIADAALSHAIDLAHRLGAQLRIVVVVEVLNSRFDLLSTLAQPVHQALAQQAQGLLDRAVIAAGAAGVAVDTRLAQVQPAQRQVVAAILHEARQWPADLIVVGSHGRRGVSRLLIGSVAEDVTRAATIPVLLFRPPNGESTAPGVSELPLFPD